MLRSISQRLLFTVAIALALPSGAEEADPVVEIDRGGITYRFPQGCMYGEAFEASFTICNVSLVDARGFRPGIIMGPGDVVSFYGDRPFAAEPQLCMDDGSGVVASCSGGGGAEPICREGRCESPCTTSDECRDGMVCSGEGKCEHFLGKAIAGGVIGGKVVPGEPGECRRFSMGGAIPQVDSVGNAYGSMKMRFFFVSDVLGDVFDGGGDTVITQQFDCHAALPDFMGVTMRFPREGLAGDLLTVERQIRNQGVIARPGPFLDPPATVEFEYGYYLSTTFPATSNDILVPLGRGDGLGRAIIGPLTDILSVDRPRIPQNLPPGSYFLSLVIDPRMKLEERLKNNNVLSDPEPIEIREAPLAIVTDTIPELLVGSNPIFQFQARGGSGAYEWEAVGVPPGVALGVDGVLQGSPTEPGVHAITVTVRSRELRVDRPYPLEVVTAAGPLAILTSQLPLAIPGKAYIGTRLVASGGRPPYEWSLEADSGRLPTGLTGPDKDGWIGGTATLLAKSAEIVVRVTDEAGNRALRTLLLPVRGSEPLRIIGSFEDGEGGEDYPHSCVGAGGGEPPYQWEFKAQEIPRGLEVDLYEDELCLSGVPSGCGDFRIGLVVRDESDGTLAASLPLSIACGELRLLLPEDRNLARGEEVALELGTSPESDASFHLAQGVLPPGLSLAPSGTITGTVDEAAQPGVYDAAIEFQDEAGRRGRGALSLRVLAPELERAVEKVEERGGGCQAPGASGGGLLGLLLFALFAFGRGSSGGRGERSSRLTAGSVAFAAALFALLAAGCDEVITDTITHGLCHEASCEEGLSCDPFDGLCKCGGENGVVCKEGEVCIPGSPSHCESRRCEFVECAEGERCDPATGLCSCDGRSCAEGEACVDDRCVPTSLCDGVRCGPGMSCDEVNGSCTCAGASCDEGESCVEGICVIDLCSGVSCGANEVCSPYDGACHCGGPLGEVCTGGESCFESEDESGAETFVCVFSRACEGVSCAAGTICDPADGRCRCGGIGPSFPACSEDQRCLDGQCMGGGLCVHDGAPIECPEGLSCDPATGECSCGGVGGSLCGPEERCVTVPGGKQCAAGCTLLEVPSTCEEDFDCYYDEATPEIPPSCRATGEKVRGSSCNAPGECGPGLHCGLAKICRQLCLVEEGRAGCGMVSPTHVCLELGGAAKGVGICVQG